MNILLGVAVYDRRGNLVAMTPELGKLLSSHPSAVSKAISEGHQQSSFVRLAAQPVHVLALPLDRQNEVVGGLAGGA